jgi:hypothetical protein
MRSALIRVVAVRLACTVTEEAGTGSQAVVTRQAHHDTPFGAAVLNVNMQLVAAPEFRLVGLHTGDDNVAGAVAGGATGLTVAVCEPRSARLPKLHSNTRSPLRRYRPPL